MLPFSDSNNCAGLDTRFSVYINPLIQASCSMDTDCHGSGSTSGPGELLTYDQIKNAAVQIKSAAVQGRMPLGSALSSYQVQAISCWVDSGTPNN